MTPELAGTVTCLTPPCVSPTPQPPPCVTPTPPPPFCLTPLCLTPLCLNPHSCMPLCLLPVSLCDSDTPNSCVCCQIDFAWLSILLESFWILRCLSCIGPTSKMVAPLPFTFPHRKVKQRRIFMRSKVPTVSQMLPALTFCASQC